MARLEARAHHDSEGELEKTAVERHIAEVPFRSFVSQLTDYHSFRAAPRERVSISGAIETLRSDGQKYGLTFHKTPTFEEQRHVIHALANARDFAHTHDSATKLLSQLDDMEMAIKAKKLDSGVQSERMEKLTIMRKHVLMTVNDVEPKLLEWAFDAAERLIEQAKAEKKMPAVVDLQTQIASLLLSQKYYVVTAKQFIDMKEEVDRVAQRLAYDEIIKEGKRKSF